MSAAPFHNAKFRTLDQLADWLEEEFPPKCIKRDELEATARHYAAQQELAERLVATIRGDD